MNENDAVVEDKIIISTEKKNYKWECYHTKNGVELYYPTLSSDCLFIYF